MSACIGSVCCSGVSPSAGSFWEFKVGGPFLPSGQAPTAAKKNQTAPNRQGAIFYLTNSYRCDTLFLVVIRRFNRVSQIGLGRPKVRFEDAPRRSKEGKTSCVN
jgi:hypothetical protein